MNWKNHRKCENIICSIPPNQKGEKCSLDTGTIGQDDGSEQEQLDVPRLLSPEIVPP